jgi:hypothetical protein
VRLRLPPEDDKDRIWIIAFLSVSQCFCPIFKASIVRSSQLMYHISCLSDSFLL